MSRIGKKPIKLIPGITVTVNASNVEVKGPKGTLSFELRPEVGLNIVDGEVTVEVKTETKESSALAGTTRAIVNNMVKGVTEGFEKKLELVGVGYRAKMNGPQMAVLTVGYSKPVEFAIPNGVTGEVVDQFLTLKGIDKYLVGQVAANIRKIREPEPYKGKGIKYVNERIRRKQGKSGKA